MYLNSLHYFDVDEYIFAGQKEHSHLCRSQAFRIVKQAAQSLNMEDRITATLCAKHLDITRGNTAHSQQYLWIYTTTRHMRLLRDIWELNRTIKTQYF